MPTTPLLLEASKTPSPSWVTPRDLGVSYERLGKEDARARVKKEAKESCEKPRDSTVRAAVGRGCYIGAW